jgi:hypothetical protein
MDPIHIHRMVAVLLGACRMSQIRQCAGTDEPVGIVISRGVREEVAPRVSAYIWGPVPEDERPVIRAA